MILLVRTNNLLRYSDLTARGTIMSDPEGNIDGLIQPGEMEDNPTRTIDQEDHQEKEAASAEEVIPFVVYTAIPHESVAVSTAPLEPEETGPQDNTHAQCDSAVGQSLSNVKQILHSCKYYSLTLGAVIGAFIQLSCMGAFFLYNASTKRGELPNVLHLNGTRNQIIFFSLVWSGLTSAIGFWILLVLSALFQWAQKATGAPSHEAFLLHMELNVATGAVVGVSLAWTAKNYMLGGNVFFWQSLFTFGAALVYAVAAKHFVLRSEENMLLVCDNNNEYRNEIELGSPLESKSNNDLSRPLLEVNSTPKSGARNSSRMVKIFSLLLGFLIGCLIQVSCLVAHYLLFDVHYFKNNGTDEASQAPTKEQAMLVCMVWDMLTSSLGIATLLLVRRLLFLHWSTGRSRTAVFDNLTQAESAVLNHFESFFALGTLAGVNLCWIVTDLLLGIRFVYGTSFVTLGAFLLWCWIYNTPSRTEAAVEAEPTARGSVTVV
jgi:hypothetical protein